MKNTQIGLCPSAPNLLYYYDDWSASGGYAPNCLYWYNDLNGGAKLAPFSQSTVPNMANPFPSASLAEIDKPAECIATGDTKGKWGGIGSCAQLVWCCCTTRATGPCNCLNGDPPFFGDQATLVGRHNGGPNLAFLDGHAKWMKLQVVGTTRHPTLRDVNNLPVFSYFSVKNP
jgi:prepilin-type processing-associated H-X9-DG protein